MMSPEWTGFAFGLLVGAAKAAAIGTIGFGIAWLRARRRIRELEAERLESSLSDERLRALEEGIGRIGAQLDRLVESSGDARPNLTGGTASTRRLPAERESEPPLG
jgi:hypothetical protein